jgi:hypothetical protein
MPISARSFGFADPDTGIGFAYVMDRLGFRLVDPTEPALRNTLFHDILGARPQGRGIPNYLGAHSHFETESRDSRISSTLRHQLDHKLAARAP